MLSLLAQATPPDPLWFKTLNLPAVGALAGTVIGLVGGLVAAWFGDFLKDRRDRRQASSALIAEIHAIKKLFEDSHFFEGLDYTIGAMNHETRDF
jgi:hypothetical protein